MDAGTTAEPGLAIGCGVLFLLLAVGGLLLARRLSRAARMRAAAFAAERNGELAAALASAGFAPTADAELPEDLPDLGIPRFALRRRLALAAGARNGVVWWLFDVELRGFERPGWNLEVTSSAESRDAVGRHTFALRRDPRSTLPTLLVLPDLRAEMRRQIDERLRSESLQDHRVAQWAARISDRWIQAEEGTEPRIEIPALDGRYRVTGADEDAARRALAPLVVQKLLATPGAIFAADGEWLLAGRNVVLARGHRESELPFGLSTVDELDDLLEFARAVDSALAGGRGAR